MQFKNSFLYIGTKNKTILCRQWRQMMLRIMIPAAFLIRYCKRSTPQFLFQTRLWYHAQEPAALQGAGVWLARQPQTQAQQDVRYWSGTEGSEHCRGRDARLSTARTGYSQNLQIRRRCKLLMGNIHTPFASVSEDSVFGNMRCWKREVIWSCAWQTTATATSKWRKTGAEYIGHSGKLAQHKRGSKKRGCRNETKGKELVLKQECFLRQHYEG